MARPPIEPYQAGLLDAGDGNRVYWETCGNPDGVPVLIVHGGPGSGCTQRSRGSYHPERHRIILFDQRNCGRSTPHASDHRVGAGQGLAGAELIVVEDAGHTGSKAMHEAVDAAKNRMLATILSK